MHTYLPRNYLGVHLYIHMYNRSRVQKYIAPICMCICITTKYMPRANQIYKWNRPLRRVFGLHSD